MTKQREIPISVFGVPQYVNPQSYIKIPLWWHATGGINWNELGEVCSLRQIEEAILQSANQHLPNGLLPALDPSDIVLLAEGEFWIDRDWALKPIALPPQKG